MKENTKTKFGFSKKQLATWLRNGAKRIETQGKVLHHMYSHKSGSEMLYCAVGSMRDYQGAPVSLATAKYFGELADLNDSSVSFSKVARRMRADARAFEHGKVLV